MRQQFLAAGFYETSYPGSVATQILLPGLANMKQYLVDMGAQPGPRSSADPVVMAYFTTCLKPALGNHISTRNEHEMQTVGTSLDYVLKGDLWSPRGRC